MLRFIVLGEIPGTHFVVTFSWVLIAALMVLVISEFSIFYNRSKTPVAAKAKNPTALQPARLIGRIVQAPAVNTVFHRIGRFVRLVRPNA